jgi:hypothetical protein
VLKINEKTDGIGENSRSYKIGSSHINKETED